MVSRRTGGVFDVTIAPLLKAWKRAKLEGRPPSAADIAAARRCVGYDKIETSSPDRIRFRADCVEIDLGGIGKGYAVDRAIALLKAAGINSALVNGGGSSIASIGAPPGAHGWPVRLGESASSSTTLLSARSRPLHVAAEPGGVPIRAGRVRRDSRSSFGRSCRDESGSDGCRGQRHPGGCALHDAGHRALRGCRRECWPSLAMSRQCGSRPLARWRGATARPGSTCHMRNDQASDRSVSRTRFMLRLAVVGVALATGAVCRHAGRRGSADPVGRGRGAVRGESRYFHAGDSGGKCRRSPKRRCPRIPRVCGGRRACSDGLRPSVGWVRGRRRARAGVIAAAGPSQVARRTARASHHARRTRQVAAHTLQLGHAQPGRAPGVEPIGAALD